MSEHGFERIDKIVAHLAAQMNDAFEGKKCDNDSLHGTYRRAVTPETDCAINGPVWTRHANLNELFEQMNARFEVVAKRLRLPNRDVH